MTLPARNLQVAGEITTGPGTDAVYLHPGNLLVCTEPTTVSTILGSCVALCLFDPTTRIGAINHYLLPVAPAHGGDPQRFGDTANPLLLERITAAGARTRHLQGMVFGGAAVMRAFRTGPGSNLGADNVQQARGFLREAGIPIQSESCGGLRGRKVTFHSGDGRILVRTL